MKRHKEQPRGNFRKKKIRNQNKRLCRNKKKSMMALSSIQFSSVAQSCPTLCDPMNCSTPGLPVHHQLPEFTQTHFHLSQSSWPATAPQGFAEWQDGSGGSDFPIWDPACIPREGNGTRLQYSCLENPMAEEPGRLQSMGSLRVRQD